MAAAAQNPNPAHQEASARLNGRAACARGRPRLDLPITDVPAESDFFNSLQPKADTYQHRHTKHPTALKNV